MGGEAVESETLALLKNGFSSDEGRTNKLAERLGAAPLCIGAAVTIATETTECTQGVVFRDSWCLWQGHDGEERPAEFAKSDALAVQEMMQVTCSKIKAAASTKASLPIRTKGSLAQVAGCAVGMGRINESVDFEFKASLCYCRLKYFNPRTMWRYRT
jgi:hypothetical protein